MNTQEVLPPVTGLMGKDDDNDDDDDDDNLTKKVTKPKKSSSDEVWADCYVFL